MKITEQYRTLGVQNFYSCPSIQKTYQNPHGQFIIECLNNSFYQYFTENASVLDLGSGNGLISHALKTCGVHNIEGSDKYMYERYTEETGFKCYPYSFEDISDFNCTFEKEYDVIICSYAFDLVPESYRQKLLYALSTYTETLILIRPNSHELISDIWKLEYKNRTGKSRVTMYQKERHS
ncbi:putative S-adenosyl-L-methionine-dependent methyltransferase [Erwinia phage pEa_SNUABM_50]|uniref:S-adenosyl-L-methionine-dependent methyltransferase n=4 Tax=Eneladusvirus BF TaxID=2560751 RepID=A0A1S6UBD2_9CAUD|nr:tRNA methyltransferase [Serratia phage BF]QOI71462.1 putative S-adenosyl-L-methionine-dependent methyltransferase [Erwinia phage pEa_SNUABM_12]QOI71961.1 putative S-adenosyl-L-methionine-dependent methyltransferase [Erwinia phage pEa_SNUABM_47]QOI72501.1 putative S-adenosyl-L-methionine-dependent methyltransferase [Erwinia phage pEa_SNUABM_50]QXO11632.1 hypothetical protein pEaSNUABM19_00521 [Erwinia phage pEa_SNUABM_19]QXO12180.1 hypothetical protein pEaSNUABM44_00519 [Erwinia phage pEa_SN